MEGYDGMTRLTPEQAADLAAADNSVRIQRVDQVTRAQDREFRKWCVVEAVKIGSTDPVAIAEQIYNFVNGK